MATVNDFDYLLLLGIVKSVDNAKHITKMCVDNGVECIKQLNALPYEVKKDHKKYNLTDNEILNISFFINVTKGQKIKSRKNGLLSCLNENDIIVQQYKFIKRKRYK